MSAPRRFTVQYTRGDTLATETAVLVAVKLRWLSCNCTEVTFDRPGGLIVDAPERQRAATGRMQAIAVHPHCRVRGQHPAKCVEVVS